MTKTEDTGAAAGADFPEEDRVRDGPMRNEIMTMVIEALNKQGYPDLDEVTISQNPAHRRAVIEMLRDCRPMPVVLELIEDVESARPVTARRT